MPTLVTIAPGHQLAPAPAASAMRMFAAGCPAAITSSYRSSARQAELRALYLAGKGAFALPPGRSLHERGEAVDWKADAAEWVRDHPEYGWRFTNPDEWWHTDYILALDRTLHTLTPPTPTEEDDMPTAREIADEILDTEIAAGDGGLPAKITIRAALSDIAVHTRKGNTSAAAALVQATSAAGRAQTARDQIKLHREAAQKGQE